MAKPITPTPVIRGSDAQRIMREIVNGSPRTPEREARLKEADRVYREVSQRSQSK